MFGRRQTERRWTRGKVKGEKREIKDKRLHIGQRRLEKKEEEYGKEETGEI